MNCQIEKKFNIYKVTIELIKYDIHDNCFLAGDIDTAKAAESLLRSGSISTDVMLLFDEIYVQKSEEYVGGASYGADEQGQLYKGVVCFMIIGLKSNLPYVIRSVPEINIKGEWLKGEILSCIGDLQKIGFNVRGVVCDNHPSNVSAFGDISAEYGKGDELRVWINDQAMYLFYDPVHLIKNVRNNLLARKQFLFPPFICKELYDDVVVAGGQISWSLLHEVHTKDSQCQANLRAAPKLTKTVLHPGNCKQSVPVALAVFDPTTRAAILQYCPLAQDAADFLKLFHTWWVISNSKERFKQNNWLGNASVCGDGKPLFLRMFAQWLQEWQNQKLPNCQKFTLSGQTSAALIHTAKCQAALIEDLLSEGYEYVMTARFQSDPLEKRYGQYRQMSGGRFLVSVKDVSRSENICKIKSLVKEGFDIEPSLKVDEVSVEATEQFLKDVASSIPDADSIELNPNSRDVSDNVAGYIARKSKTLLQNCCWNNLKNECSSRPNSYVSILSRGGLITPSEDLGNAVARGFGLLDATSDVIRNSTIPSKRAALEILKNHLDTGGIVCDAHAPQFSTRLMSTICNCFFDSQRKRSNESVVVDRVAAFKANKRSKVE